MSDSYHLQAQELHNKSNISSGLFYILIDFMKARKMLVDINGTQTNAVDLPLAWVQGSTLGPRQFTIDCSGIADALSAYHYACHADASYVVVVDRYWESSSTHLPLVHLPYQFIYLPVHLPTS